MLNISIMLVNILWTPAMAWALQLPVSRAKLKIKATGITREWISLE